MIMMMDAAPKPPEGKAYFAEILIFFAVFLPGDVAEFGTIQLHHSTVKGFKLISVAVSFRSPMLPCNCNMYVN